MLSSPAASIAAAGLPPQWQKMIAAQSNVHNMY
jgi:hypothetical protein